MAKKGLGKGLASLIPDIYDDTFDSNSSKSLEDLLKEEDEPTEVEDTVEAVEDEIPEEKSKEETPVEENDEPAEEETSKETEEEIPEENDVEAPVEEDIEEVVEDEDDSTGEEIEPATEEISQEKGENSEETETSEDLSGDSDSEEVVQTPEELKRQQENVAEVKEIVEKNPRITLWSSRSSAVFRYLRKTEPEFSISKEASILIEEAVSKKYPEIWKLFEDE